MILEEQTDKNGTLVYRPVQPVFLFGLFHDPLYYLAHRDRLDQLRVLTEEEPCSFYSFVGMKAGKFFFS
jgi:hypothetical protein